MARAEAYLHAKFHLDPSNRLATVHERHSQTDRETGQTDRKRSDSIRRTVLQTVTQKTDTPITSHNSSKNRTLSIIFDTINRQSTEELFTVHKRHTQPSTEQFSQLSLLSSRQSSQLR